MTTIDAIANIACTAIICATFAYTVRPIILMVYKEWLKGRSMEEP